MAVDSINNSVNTVSDYSKVNQYAANTVDKDSEAKAASKEGKKEDIGGVVYEKSDNATTSVNSTFDRAKIQNLLKEGEEQRMESFRKLIESVVESQVKKTYEANGLSLSGKDVPKGNLKDYFANMQVDEETRLQAQKDIDEDGYFGVEKTAKRIVDFAKSLAGGDESKFQTLRDAAMKGFENAAKLWGDDLPEISQRTYDRVNELFDEWQEEFSKKTGTVLSGTENL